MGEPVDRSEITQFTMRWGLSPACSEALEALFIERMGAVVVAEANETFVDGSPETGGAAIREPELVPARYEDLGRIGLGGMGEVRRVRDKHLGRTCAFKVVRLDRVTRPTVVARFVDEAQVAAQLQHPNIPPVYDAGRLPDGRPWFSMKEVRGRTLGEVVQSGERLLPWLVDTFSSVCDAVGYAHARGVVHRDLKPENVMIGEHGEVLVLDWGLAKVVGRPDLAGEEGELEPEVATARSGDESQNTQVGGVLGTAAYMAPEQARGEIDRLDARTDVYALGAILYEILAGRAPYVRRAGISLLQQVIDGPPDPPARPGTALPAELVSLCARCMAREQDRRPVDGAAVGAEARAWLDGAKKREKALEIAARAEGMSAEVRGLRARASALRLEGAALLSGLAPSDPEARKAPGWARQDEAAVAEAAAVRLESQQLALWRGALTHAPDLEEAHVALAEVAFALHAEAEVGRDGRVLADAEAHLREHAGALPAAHPVALRIAAYLLGDGALTLDTSPPGADVVLFRHEVRNRRLVEVPVRRLGPAPLREVSLPMGSYVCVLEHPARAPVRYPVAIGRGERWDGGGPVWLPPPGALGPDDCLVPGGWFWSGGDPEAGASLPRRRLWCDTLVVKRFPVTNREYMAFLDDLVARGREDEALRHAPRERVAELERSQVYGRDATGRFVLRADADGDTWDPDWPVMLVDWFGASAYAAWLADRTGRPWRLPMGLEWEKTARGVDGRFHPWGDGFDPTWCCMGSSQPDRALPAVVDSFPVDVSVYGVRGLAGNVQEWCADVFVPEGPALPDGRVVVDLAPGDTTSLRGRAGGGWSAFARSARSAVRGASFPAGRSADLGFRCVYRPDDPLAGPPRGDALWLNATGHSGGARIRREDAYEGRLK